MCNDYLDRLVEYLTIQSQKRFNARNKKYGSLKNLMNPKIIFSYQVYRNEEGITYSANLYYWYYLLLIVL